MRRHLCAAVAVFAIVLFALALASASITGSISGVVTDPSGAVVAGATVVATNTETGIKTTLTTDAKGFYSFTALPIGTYNVEIRQSGFKAYRQEGLVIDVNSALRADVSLQLGQISEVMSVTTETAQVETENTQMGEVISATRMTSVPLNGRSYTDLLSLQPGVVPSAYGNQAPDTSDRAPSGGLNPGNQSINGQRESSNGFMVNGSNVEEGKNNGAAVVPNLDSIAEFRIITNNFDAEYGNYSGGQINVATKSGTNGLHGTAFDFLRNTALDAKNYFALATDPTPVFRQNQFGGTLGGPIKRDKVFFFVDYQGTRRTQAATVQESLPTQADLGGNLFDQLDPAGSFPVVGSAFATTLQTRLQVSNPGQVVTAGEPYYFSGCNSTDPSSGCVFPGGIIPPSSWSPAAAGIVPFIPQPNALNNPNFNYVTSGFPQKLRDDKAGFRVDGNTRLGLLSGYYFIDDYFLADPFDQVSVPGFTDVTPGRAQLFTFSVNKVLSSASLNEFQVSFTRNSARFNKPQGGLGHTLVSLGFTAPEGSGAGFNGGIAPINPAIEGVPNIAFNNFSLGVPADTNGQFNNTYQIQDNFSKVVGTHTLKFGASFHYDQINERNFFGENGAFTFDGSETGSDFADFLIGAPAQDGGGFIQASRQVLDSRTKYFGVYAQDSWRARPSLTINYGLRYEISTPWYDTQNKIETIVPGQQSVVFPNAPLGWVVPGDKGIPRTLAPIKYNNFSPRLGIAYSPNASSGWVTRLTGGPGKSSIRAGFGLFYTAIEDLTQFQEVGDPPYGLFWVSPSPPLFEAPFINRADGTTVGQKFPFAFPPTNVSAKNPYAGFDWSLVEPISAGVAFNKNNALPYGEHYEFSLQREIGASTIVTASYVGTQGHKLLTFVEANPADAALCLFLSDPANVVDPNNTCGPGGENPSTAYQLINPGSAPGYPGVGSFVTTRLLKGLNTAANAPFADNPYEWTIANSAYNSLQGSLRHNTGIASFLVSYTYSKCMDNSSGLEERTNPFNPRASRSLCAFDVKQNFVGSYTVRLPFERLMSENNTWGRRLIGGWELSGITSFVTGLPVTISENDDHSLTGARGVDRPVLTGVTKILNNTNPRSRQPYFNSFSPGQGGVFDKEPTGQIGNASRRFFHGPGIYNFDMALQKAFAITESKKLELRFEAFNVFNHAQFQNPDGNIRHGFPDTGGTFGLVSGARDPRIMQVAMKFVF